MRLITFLAFLCGQSFTAEARLIPAGQAPLTLRALEIPGNSVMDVRRVTLTLLD